MLKFKLPRLRLSDRGTAAAWTASGALVVIVLGALDYMTGPELSFSIFYVLPVSLIAMNTRSRTMTFAICVLSTLTWLVADITSGHVYSYPMIPYWNMLVRFGFFLLIAMLILKIRILKGLLPICAWCKKMRDESGRWIKMEEYISRHSEADFTHGICPDCMNKIDDET